MRERIESVGDILLAAAHADHHVEAAEIDRIETILKTIWRERPTAEAAVRRVASFHEGEALGKEELDRLGDMLQSIQGQDDLPSALVQRLADFDPGRFDMDEAVGPFLHESVDFKRRLLEMAVSVHEADGELDFAEDTFIRELGFKLGLELGQFQDLLLEFVSEVKDGDDEPDDAVAVDLDDTAVIDAPRDAPVAHANGEASELPTTKVIRPTIEPPLVAAAAASRSNGRPAKEPAAKKSEAKPAAKVAKKAKPAAKKKVKAKVAKKKKAKAKPAAKKKAKAKPAAKKAKAKPAVKKKAKAKPAAKKAKAKPAAKKKAKAKPAAKKARVGKAKAGRKTKGR